MSGRQEAEVQKERLAKVEESKKALEKRLDRRLLKWALVKRSALRQWYVSTRRLMP